MTNFTNDDLYQFILNRLRKDRKGSISPEEFESFLRIRNMDYFSQQIGNEGISSINHESLAPFTINREQSSITDTDVEEGYLPLDPDYIDGETVDNIVAKLINVWYLPPGSGTDLKLRVPVDIVPSTEWAERFENAITEGGGTEPIGYIGTYYHPVRLVTYDVLWLMGMTNAGGGSAYVDYYKYPTDPYYDYYTDANGNITYLTDGQAEYTLQAGEVSRSGLTAGSGVTSVSVDLAWRDQDAMNILDMVMSDAGLAQNDPSTYQASLLERQNNVKQ